MADAAVATQAPSTAIPIPRMIGMVISLAISAVIGYALWMWAVSPNYTSLYTGLEARDASEVVAALQAAGIPYELDGAAGVVMVESGRVHEAVGPGRRAFALAYWTATKSLSTIRQPPRGADRAIARPSGP